VTAAFLFESAQSIHDEPRRRREKLQRADLIVDELLSAILRDLNPQNGAVKMTGASLTLTVLDSELKALWDAPVRTSALTW
jgi:dihydroxyacetone kinase-like protein